MDLYGHAFPGMDFEAANAMGDALFGEQDEIERKEQQLRQELAVLAARKQKRDSSKVVASLDSFRDAKALDATGEAGS